MKYIHDVIPPAVMDSSFKTIGNPFYERNRNEIKGIDTNKKAICEKCLLTVINDIIWEEGMEEIHHSTRDVECLMLD